jgi:hypothetical protein
LSIISQPPSGDCGEAMISPLRALHFALPIACQPVSDDPWKVKSGMKSWVAAKMAESNTNTAASVEILVFVDIKRSFPGRKRLRDAKSRFRSAIATEIITAEGRACGRRSYSVAAAASEIALIDRVDAPVGIA